jgi:lipoprotein-anchoring transpeptidase ErfK/SrfK
LISPFVMNGANVLMECYNEKFMNKGDDYLYRKFLVFFLLLSFLIIPFSMPATADAASDTGSLVIDRTDFPTLYLSENPIRGEAVWMVQARLKEIGYDIEPNGVYDRATNDAVVLFQVSNAMEADGVVDQEVWQALMSSNEESLYAAEMNSDQQGKMLIVIDVAKRTLVLYEDGQEVCKYPVAVGKASTPSPLGEWKVVHKSTNWGNGFGTRWMGLNVPWGIYGIHGTNKPGSIGSFASHGCIRMFNRDVEKLYPLVPWGCKVKIVNDGRIIVPEKVKLNELKLKSSGQQVVFVQARLKELGIEFDNADGRFGNMTELGVKYFQIWHGLEPTGVVDEATYKAMGLSQ